MEGKKKEQIKKEHACVEHATFVMLLHTVNLVANLSDQSLKQLHHKHHLAKLLRR